MIRAMQMVIGVGAAVLCAIGAGQVSLARSTQARDARPFEDPSSAQAAVLIGADWATAPNVGRSEAIEGELQRALHELEAQIRLQEQALRTIGGSGEDRQALAEGLQELRAARSDLARMLRQLLHSRHPVFEAALPRVRTLAA